MNECKPLPRPRRALQAQRQVGEQQRRALTAPAQGLTAVHFSAQLEPCLTQENTLHTLNTLLARAAQPLRATRDPYKALQMS